MHQILESSKSLITSKYGVTLGATVTSTAFFALLFFTLMVSGAYNPQSLLHVIGYSTPGIVGMSISGAIEIVGVGLLISGIVGLLCKHTDLIINHQGSEDKTENWWSDSEDEEEYQKSFIERQERNSNTRIRKNKNQRPRISHKPKPQIKKELSASDFPTPPNT